MPTSPMLDMGPCELVWGYGDSTAAYLGKTHGGVKVSMETNASDILEDQNGDAPVNAVLTGSVVTVECSLTRLSKEQLALAMNTTVQDHIVPIINQVGCDMYDDAKSLVLKPVCAGVTSTDASEWVELYKAYPVVGMDLTYDKDTQRIFPVTFKCFVHQDSPYTGMFGTIGMDSASTEFGI